MSMNNSEALERMRDAMRLRHLAMGTEKSYLLWPRKRASPSRG
jgi:hypothetical protein